MKCEVRNTTSSETFTIPAEGSVFGRQGGPANITVADQSVSKRHARVYMDGGKWFLEDLKSVNGTVVNNRRITEPVALSQGFVFSISKHQFEVLNIEGERPASQRSSRNNPAPAAAESLSDSRRGGAQAGRSQPASRSRQQPPPSDMEPLLPPGEPSAASSRHDARGERSVARGRQEPSYDDRERSNDRGRDRGREREEEDDERGYNDDAPAEGLSAGEAIGRAFGYFLKTVPLMALNPIGTVRKGVEQPELPFMEKMPLGLFLVPAYAAGMGIQSGAAGLSALIAGGGGVVSAVIGVAIGAGIGVVSAIIGGFLAHPLIRFFVEKIFKGETNETTRTNATVMGATAMVLVMLVQSGQVLASGVITRAASLTKFAGLLAIVPALVGVIAMPLLFFVMYSWLKAWRTAKWAQTLFLVLAVVMLILGLKGAADVGIASVKALGSGGGAAAVDVPADAAQAIKDAEEKIKAAQAAARAAGGEVKAEVVGEATAPVDAAKPEQPKVEGKPQTDKPVEAAAPADGTKTGAVAAIAPREDPAPVAAGTVTAGTVARKREHILKALASDPSFLVARGATLDKYKAYQRCAYAQREDANERLKEGEGKKRLVPPEYRDGTMLGDVLHALIITKCAAEIDALYAAVPK